MPIPVATDSHGGLASVFADWSRARERLRRLRTQLAPGPAAAPPDAAAAAEVAVFHQALRAQEAECARLWRELARLDEVHAQARQAAWLASVQPPGLDERAAPHEGAGGDAPVDILIVDDEANNLIALEAVLDDPGYRLVRAGSGEEALLALITGDYACLVLDVQMPGMTGVELARLVQQRRHAVRTPIILLTAHCQDDQHALEGYASGAADYVHKPFHPAVLRRKVEVFAHLHRVNRRLHLRAAEGARRAEFLDAASRALSGALDVDQALSALLGLCVPGLGEDAFLAFGGGESGARRFAMHPARNGDGVQPWAAELEAEAGQAIRSREMRLWHGSERSAAIIPLMAGEEVLGALGIVAPAACLDVRRTALAREFASRAALVLQSARLNTKVREAERRQDRFVSMLAHELRNPLAPISNAVQILQGKAARPSTRDWACEVIGRQAGRMTRLIDGLLDVACLARGKAEVRRDALALTDVVAGAVEATAPEVNQRRQAVAVELPGEPVEIQGDAARLAQALANVVHNASKFSEAGATIRIAAACAAGEVRISVQDAGSGIAPELLPHVLDVFAQAEQALDRPQGGLGVGLTLARHVVELHGGRIAVHSEGPGKGTEVVLRLPARPAPARVAAHAPAPPPIATRPPAPANAQALRVLVVDDETSSAETLMALLEIKGFDVRIAHDGLAAIQAAEAFLPDVVVLDIGLPGMNGFEVAQRLRTQPRLREALLIALTGYGDAETRLRSAQAGFDSHMTKPADVDRLLRMLADPGATRQAGECRLSTTSAAPAPSPR